MATASASASTSSNMALRRKTVPVAPVPIAVRGYLFKLKSKARFIGSWNKRWFAIQPTSKELLYFKSKSASSPSGGIDLDSITSVRKVGELLFNVESPARNFVLRTENEATTNEWVNSIHAYITNLAIFKAGGQQPSEGKRQAASTPAPRDTEATPGATESKSSSEGKAAERVPQSAAPSTAPQQETKEQQQQQQQAQPQRPKPAAAVATASKPKAQPQAQQPAKQARSESKRAAEASQSTAAAPTTPAVRRGKAFGKLTGMTPTKQPVRRQAAHHDTVRVQTFGDNGEGRKTEERKGKKTSAFGAGAGKAAAVTKPRKRVSARDLMNTTRRTDFAPLAFSDTEDDDDDIALWDLPAASGTSSATSSAAPSANQSSPSGSSGTGRASTESLGVDVTEMGMDDIATIDIPSPLPTRTTSFTNNTSNSKVAETADEQEESKHRVQPAVPSRAADAGVVADANWVTDNWDDEEEDEEDSEDEVVGIPSHHYGSGPSRHASKQEMDMAAGVAVDDNFVDADWDDEEEEEE